MSCPAFDAKAKEYKDENALFLAVCSRLAYKTKSTIGKRVINIWKMSKYHYFDRNDIQAFITKNREFIILSFRGTEPDKFRDILYDLDAAMILGPIGKVHRGFLNALTKVWYEIEAKIREYRNNNQSLWITGHSLGAALATLATAQLIRNKVPVNGLYTFGQPRTGDKVFSSNFNKLFGEKTFRVVNDKDLVTRIPPQSMGYEHIGRLVYIHSNEKLVRNPGDRIKRTLESYVNKEATLFQRVSTVVKFRKEGVADHGIDNYFMLLKKNIGT